MYPSEKRPSIIDNPRKRFGNILVQRVGDTNPMETTELNVNVVMFTKAQIEKLVRENKRLIEEVTKYKKKEPSSSITWSNDALWIMMVDVNYWKHYHQKI